MADEVQNPGGRSVEGQVFSQGAPLIDIDMFKKMYLFGVDLTDPQGRTIPDETLALFLATGISYLESILNTPIIPKRIIQRVDYNLASYMNYAFIQVPIYPIREIYTIKMIYGKKDLITFPPEWWRLYENSGQIHMMPDVSTLSAVLISQTGTLMPRGMAGKYAPQLLEVDAVVGIADENECVPPLVNQAIGLYSALYLLQMLGDIGPGGAAGITNQSLSLDGMSQSVGTAISATNNLYGATIAKYETLLNKTVMPVLRKKYKRLSLEYI